MPLARWIVAKWTGIHHGAKSLREKLPPPLLSIPLVSNHSLRFCIYAWSSWVWPPPPVTPNAPGAPPFFPPPADGNSTSVIAAGHGTSETPIIHVSPTFTGGPRVELPPLSLHLQRPRVGACVSEVITPVLICSFALSGPRRLHCLSFADGW